MSDFLLSLLASSFGLAEDAESIHPRVPSLFETTGFGSDDNNVTESEELGVMPFAEPAPAAEKSPASRPTHAGPTAVLPSPEPSELTPSRRGSAPAAEPTVMRASPPRPLTPPQHAAIAALPAVQKPTDTPERLPNQPRTAETKTREEATRRAEPVLARPAAPVGNPGLRPTAAQPLFMPSSKLAGAEIGREMRGAVASIVPTRKSAESEKDREIRATAPSRAETRLNLEPRLAERLVVEKVILGASSPLGTAPRGEVRPASVGQALSRQRQAKSAAPVSETPPAPTIQVTIGRVEIKAHTPPATPRAKPQAPAAMSLDDYLKQRRGGSP